MRFDASKDVEDEVTELMKENVFSFTVYTLGFEECCNSYVSKGYE